MKSLCSIAVSSRCFTHTCVNGNHESHTSCTKCSSCHPTWCHITEHLSLYNGVTMQNTVTIHGPHWRTLSPYIGSHHRTLSPYTREHYRTLSPYMGHILEHCDPTWGHIAEHCHPTWCRTAEHYNLHIICQKNIDCHRLNCFHMNYIFQMKHTSKVSDCC